MKPSIYFAKYSPLCYNGNMKTIIITGASGDIGSEIALTLANKNNNLVLLYKSNEQSIHNLTSKIIGKCEFSVFQCDLTNEDAIENVVKLAVDKYEKIDCLINCAGVSYFEQIQDATTESYNHVFDNNFKSTMLTISKVCKNMISNRNGKIINISSMWGVVGASVESLYSASKAAINNLTFSLAKELGPSNITINTICPGLIDTKMNSNLSAQDKDEIISNTPLKRVGTPTDVANLVEFFVSDKSNFITGQIITLDGGLTL